MTDKTLQERLRQEGPSWTVCNEAADTLDAQAERIRNLEELMKTLVRECERIPFQNKAEFSLAVGNCREATK